MAGGIVNLGSTCYLNTVLQCLLNNKRLRDYVIQLIDSEGMALIKALAKVAYILYDLKKTARPKNLLDILQNRIGTSLNLFEQNDANEFLLLFADKLVTESPKELKELAPPTHSKFKKLTHTLNEAWLKEHKGHTLAPFLYGQLVSQMECSKCGSLTHRPETFISIDIDIHSSSEKMCNLNLSIDIKAKIDEFFQKETVNQFACDKCGMSADGTKSCRLWRTPQVLTITIKRFNPVTLQKLQTPVSDLPETLNLADYVISCEPSTFSLSAIACHAGNTLGGHYFALVKNNKNKWIHIDDECVTLASSCPSSFFYMIYYERDQ